MVLVVHNNLRHGKKFTIAHLHQAYQKGWFVGGYNNNRVLDPHLYQCNFILFSKIKFNSGVTIFIQRGKEGKHHKRDKWSELPGKNLKGHVESGRELPK